MIDERLEAVRRVREEADRLRLACIAAAKTRALLHVAYDSEIVTGLSTGERVLLGQLRAVE